MARHSDQPIIGKASHHMAGVPTNICALTHSDAPQPAANGLGDCSM
jgi:hypothetical protein